jgi:hypothetical protein
MDLLPAAFFGLSFYKQFVVYVLRDSSKRAGKKDKIPINYKTGKFADHSDISIRLDITSAINISNQLGKNYGVGFVFTDDDPFWFLDIDDCLEENGDWSPLAQHLATQLEGAAIEISNSGRGLHIIGSGIAPAHKCNPQEHNLEFYTSKRFVALTGNAAAGDVTKDFTHVLPWLISTYFSIDSKIDEHTPINWVEKWNFYAASAPCKHWGGPSDDETLLKIALSAQSGRAVFNGHASFSDLYLSNIEVLARVYNNNESSYDAALAQHLAFWTGNDPERMKRLMMRSQLVREKWGRDDYLGRTIVSACEKATMWFKTNELQAPTNIESTTKKDAVLVTGSTFATIEDQLKLFKDCVYICDIHRALISGGRLLKPEQFNSIFGGYTFLMDNANQRTSRKGWDAFIDSQAIRWPRVDGVCFKPNLETGIIVEKNNRKLINSYYPITTIRKQGDPTPFLKHLEKLFPIDRDRLIITSYLAGVVQYKGRKFQWAPLIQGVEGNGKTILSYAVAYAVGETYSHFPKAKEIDSKFNEWMYGKIFIGVEDIYVPYSQREVLEALKPMITGKWIEIEPKGKDKITRDICCNFILNSNHKDGLPKTRNDRRFAPFYTPQQKIEDLERDGLTTEYFTKLVDWLDNDGYAIINEFLHTFKIPDEFNPALLKRAPMTSSTETAIYESLGTVEQEILEAVEQELPGFKKGWISSVALDHLLMRANMAHKIPRNKRRDLLLSLGYDWHPGLPNGRVNNMIQYPDMGKPRLFITKDHPTLKCMNKAEIAQQYINDQV